MEQLEFFWRDEESLQKELERQTGRALELTVTDNSSSLMSYKAPRDDGPARLRIHRMFLVANQEVLRALSVWLTRPRGEQAGKLLDDFISENEHLIKGNSGRQIHLRSKGEHFDLQELYDEVNESHFDNTVDAPITWGRMPANRRRQSIRLGSYTPEDHLIRIHPLLDQDFVPEYFVRYIVYHEMLHAFLGVHQGPNGRRRVHTPEFNKMEREYPDFDRAAAWHNNSRNLGRLLRVLPAAS